MSRSVYAEPIAGGLMVAVATFGLVANVVGTLLLHKGAKHQYE